MKLTENQGIEKYGKLCMHCMPNKICHMNMDGVVLHVDSISQNEKTNLRKFMEKKQSLTGWNMLRKR